ncbi:MAG: isoleucine--tRNA ligase [Candidatus Levybacteria bacterium RIFCSPHIGHO2_01_FULL_37_33]|uniref:Isoleucine--tRNA ligase n=1 Tax=Candidatus Blackburnbacteria bacterium RIFCSPLOWO2_01_FULL_41_27 TaxID=1797520 RepID=A0A1G1VD28_9BACT|nr:MAG: isoleucine--tRNA ligase [Candidatus Levybacteria bacterium RIFCSPHIGHO2_01_FULL_37_33]OGH30004.1 MAG: isoleucine--tRNA ligase [Candidatus Levybacteria bacterium RIFCSPHIGHO2_12_FULL_37_12]OGY13324.1 MAG: isoleucine--tRNA ligase [Candidatus Blackburnbacteria bacterium RIFCSPLOWO2_01_FULL_41_27]
MFRQVSSKVDFPKLEREILKKWYKPFGNAQGKKSIVEKYLHKNDKSAEKFSFLDGPITANNPMGVHHAWGRTYKDFWQRFWNMKGRRQRFQNGFDEQGLWVEVEVEKELGLKNKKDIENLIPGDKFKSLEKFINLCKERVKKFSEIQTEQSKRLGYFMDWDNSYHTSSDENNFTIWNFLKLIHDKGWLYKGHDSVPWCPRCGTAISQMEILTEEYKEITHKTAYFKLPIKGKKNEFLLVWTTTSWTIPSNVAVAVNKKETYEKYQLVDGDFVWIMKKRISQLLKEGILIQNKVTITETSPGSMLIGWEYDGPFDDLPLVKKTLGNYTHRVIDGEDFVTEEEGTGLLHVAPGAGREDFKLGKANKLPVISSIEEDASYLSGMGGFVGKNAKKQPEIIIDYLKSKDRGKFLLTTQDYKHRYPTCWRCKTELVWRVVDEWYIAMDKPSNSKLKTQNSKLNKNTFREQMVETAKKITWMPSWGFERELDWLRNMQDWLISKKRYWGLALPIWECKKCKKFEVIGGEEELKEKAISGWDEFWGNSPHRPWIDLVKIKCSECGEELSRIPDVGNPWLDAGIVPFSTMPEDWFPADFITESFPGQFKNWFYALIAMSTALKRTNPFKRVLGFGSVRDEKGEEMHKSRGNAIEFNEAADKIGVDVMRWLYLRTNPEHNVNFGYHATDKIRRFFHLRLWNVYTFFILYANVDTWKPQRDFKPQNVLDRWILSRMNGSIQNITKYIGDYNAYSAAEIAEIFIINDLSNWYVRRIRDRVGPSSVNKKDREDAYQTLFTVLSTYSKILAPFVPFIADEIYTNLTGEESVHLTDWPSVNESLINKKLEEEMEEARKIVEIAHSKRKEEEIKVRQPLQKFIIHNSEFRIRNEILDVIKDEVNVKEIELTMGKGKLKVELDIKITSELQREGEAREIVRMIQEERKNLGTRLDEKIEVVLLSWPKEFEDYIKKRTLVLNLKKGEKFEIRRS